MQISNNELSRSCFSGCVGRQHPVERMRRGSSKAPTIIDANDRKTSDAAHREINEAGDDTMSGN